MKHRSGLCAGPCVRYQGTKSWKRWSCPSETFTQQWETQISKLQKERRLNQAVECWEKLWKLWNIWTGWHPGTQYSQQLQWVHLHVKGRIQWYMCAVLNVSKLTTEASTNKMDFTQTIRREEVSKYQSKNISTLDSVTLLGPSLMITIWLQLLLPFRLHSSRKKGKGNMYQEDKNLPRNPHQRCLLTAHQPELWPLFPLMWFIISYAVWVRQPTVSGEWVFGLFFCLFQPYTASGHSRCSRPSSAPVAPCWGLASETLRKTLHCNSLSVTRESSRIRVWNSEWGRGWERCPSHRMQVHTHRRKSRSPGPPHLGKGAPWPWLSAPCPPAAIHVDSTNGFWISGLGDWRDIFSAIHRDQKYRGTGLLEARVAVNQFSLAYTLKRLWSIPEQRCQVEKFVVKGWIA